MSTVRPIAAHVIDIMGGADAVAKIVGRSTTAVYRWTYPRGRGGTDGLVPARFQQQLLNAAIEQGLPLSPNDFFEPVSDAA